MSSLSRYGRLFGFGLGLVVAGGSLATAGDLALNWQPSHDEVTAGYEVEVLDASGHVDQVVDAKNSTDVTVHGLADGTIYKFRVRPYDQWGNKADEASDELTTMAAPRVDALEHYAATKDGASFTLVGANFAPGARVVASRPGLTVVAAEVKSATEMSVQVRNTTGTGMPMAQDFLVANHVRRSEQFLAQHPELLDVNGDGTVDRADIDLITKSFGAISGKPTYRAELDVNGDGVIDGADAAAVRARGTASGHSGEAAPKTTAPASRHTDTVR